MEMNRRLWEMNRRGRAGQQGRAVAAARQGGSSGRAAAAPGQGRAAMKAEQRRRRQGRAAAAAGQRWLVDLLSNLALIPCKSRGRERSIRRGKKKSHTRLGFFQLSK